jgi:hypothetical protein
MPHSRRNRRASRQPRPAKQPASPRFIAVALLSTFLVWGGYASSTHSEAGGWLIVFWAVLGLSLPGSFLVFFYTLRRGAPRDELIFIVINNLAILIGLFAFAYWNAGTRGNWNMRLSHLDALYVAVGTLTTAGTGAIQAQSELARTLLTAQMVVDIVAFTLVTGILVTRLSSSRE